MWRILQNRYQSRNVPKMSDFEQVKASNMKTHRKLRKNLEKPSILMTADGQLFYADRSYFFYDESKREVLSSVGLRPSGEHLCSLGWNVVPISRLRASRADAVKDGQRALFREIEQTRERMHDLS